MIRVATAAVNATSSDPPTSSHPTNATIARTITIGTNTPETRSARRCTFALPVWASSISRCIRASSVSAPTRVISTIRRPPTFTVAPTTREPVVTSTGTDSPVSMLASIADAPSTTRPSEGIFSPGRTSTRSPTISCETGTSCSTPPTRRVASFAPRCRSARSASVEDFLARASAYRPARMNTVTRAATSR